MSRAPARSLADLKGMRAELQAQAQARAERERAAAAARERQERQQASARDLFLRAAGAVQPLVARERVPTAPPPPAPIPRQHLADERAALHESLSDEFDITTLLEIDEQMSFRRPGIGADVTARLRRGHWSIQAHLDLHGLRRDAAREALAAFLRKACASGLRCVRVVHGKGNGSPGKTPVLKNRVLGWLVQKAEVLAFVQARPADGGAGAVVVLLRPATATATDATG